MIELIVVIPTLYKTYGFATVSVYYFINNIANNKVTELL